MRWQSQENQESMSSSCSPPIYDELFPIKSSYSPIEHD